MSKGYSWKNLCAVFIVGLMVGCKRSDNSSTNYFATPFQDESQFIVETIVSDLTEEVFYAKYHQLPNPKYFSVRAVEKPDSPFGAPAYKLRIALNWWRPDLKIELKVNGPIWSPDVYQGVAAALARKVGLVAAKPKTPADTALLLGLTEREGCHH